MPPVGERPAAIDLSLEREINAQSSQLEQDASGVPENGLLAPFGSSAPPTRPIKISCVDVLDQKLQHLSVQLVAAADGDEEVLRLALAACSENDEAGLLAFVKGLMKVEEVLGPRIERREAAMKLMTGWDAAEVIQAIV
jgi:hypothetical protein